MTNAENTIGNIIRSIKGIVEVATKFQQKMYTSYREKQMEVHGNLE